MNRRFSDRCHATAASTGVDAGAGQPPPGQPVAPAALGFAGLRDAFERSVLLADTLRQRGTMFAEHQAAGEPALLKFDHELVLDGRDLPRKCNYALLHVLPPADAPTNPAARALVVVDPRAGHGPGIGGFKRDSEVGVALRAGHPVYFVTFRPQPEEGQTLWDVMNAEIRFLEEVAARHPSARLPPVVVGNCQAGWASAMLAARRPDLVGTLMLVGSPLSYWAGASTMNPMRYSGAPLGGAWLASMTSDLAGGRFDGAHLVDNFERLNPAHTLWSRWYKLWSQIDDEGQRFLEFERWWGGYFRMTGAEMDAIVENLFVGNRLARGEVQTDDGQRIDLRAITAPIVVFASWGDNITPPPQALDWIIDCWGDERAIAAAGRTIVYVLHDSVGHLGIFVGADIARKEHDQIVTSMDVIDHLPPGLYEMKVVRKDDAGVADGGSPGAALPRWDALEPGSYTVHFEHRTMDDLRALNPEGRDEEQLFARVDQLSQFNSALYKTWVRPWLHGLQAPLRAWGDAATAWHPLRMQRSLFDDRHPAADWVRQLAQQVRAQRHAVPADHPQRAWEKTLTAWIENALNCVRDARDQAVVRWTRWAFGPLGWGAWLPARPSDEAVAVARAAEQIEQARAEVLPRIAEGGFPQAVCRIVLAGMLSIGSFERRSFRLARLLTELPARGDAGTVPPPVAWHRMLRDEARIAAVAPVEALGALAQMLPDNAARERALAMAAAVMMIEPTLAHPRSEIIELLMQMLAVDPAAVIALAKRLTAPVAEPVAETVAEATAGLPAVAATAPLAAASIAGPPRRRRAALATRTTPRRPAAPVL